MSLWRMATENGRWEVSSQNALPPAPDHGLVLVDVPELNADVLAQAGIPAVPPWEVPQYGLWAVSDRIVLVAPIVQDDVVRPMRLLASTDRVVVVDGGAMFETLASRVRWSGSHVAAHAVFQMAEIALASVRSAVRSIETDLDELEEAMIAGVDGTQLGSLHALHRQIATIRRSLRGYVDSMAEANDDIETDSSMSAEVLDLTRRHEAAAHRLTNELSAVREEAEHAMDLFRSLTSTRQSVVVNRLTAISALLLPLTVVTGFFGMNFGWLVDETASSMAFWTLGVALPGLLATSVVLLVHRAGWLRGWQVDEPPDDPP